MSSSMNYVQAIVGLSAVENTSGRMEAGARKVEEGERQRKVLEKEMQRQQEKIDRLNEEREEIEDRSDFETFWDDMWGSDGGMGEVQDKLNRAGAEMGKASHQLRAEQAKIELALKEVQEAQAELGKRANARQETWDEHDRSLQVISC